MGQKRLCGGQYTGGRRLFSTSLEAFLLINSEVINFYTRIFARFPKKIDAKLSFRE